LGQARSALGIEKEGGMDIEIFKKSFAKLPKKTS
jgi:hypothetical protein